ncbi:FKBP-type peptidyl-prolyl cis-trans isomerase [Terasakiella pusilla]|uniref:FKBP-type peptidyl-prolyl cis-trans isomerase n=1 Tax=Terasakiella pusilla TaxID=64973 RepID=UPI003AA7B68C
MKRQVIRLIGFFIVLILNTPAPAAELQVTDLVHGTGPTALKGASVVVHYTGTLANGKKFDSSYDRNQPFEFQLGARQVIPGWEKGLVGMQVGGKRKLVIPPELGYGARGAGNVIPPNATLHFDIELLEVKEPPFKNIGNAQLKELRQQGVKLIDIRTPEEWKETGVIEGSLLLPFKMSNGRFNSGFVEDMARLVEKDEPFILICRTGNRSQAAAQGLSHNLGYSSVYNVTDGITHWKAEKNTTIKPDLNNLKNTCSKC